LARIAKAQKLMAEQKIDAIFMEGTTSCLLRNMKWGQSERTFGLSSGERRSGLRLPQVRRGSGLELIKLGKDARGRNTKAPTRSSPAS
jgi:hypothetical protein